MALADVNPGGRYIPGERSQPGKAIAHIAYRVTDECNQLHGPCGKICFSNEGTFFYPFLKTVQKTLKDFQESGGIGVNIYGGEPLLRPDIVDILKYGYDLGLEMTLSTNCNLMTPELLEQIAPYIKYLSVSLDGPDSKINNRYRGKNQFEAVTRVIDQYDPSRHNFALKVNTRVTKENINLIDNIGLLFGDKPIIWKLIQFTPRAAALEHRDKYAISLDEFQSKLDQLKVMYQGGKIYFTSRSYADDEAQDAFLIRTDGSAVTNVTEKYDLVGNVYEEPMLMVIQRVEERFRGFRKENLVDYNESYAQKQ